MSPLYELAKEGVDLKSVKWAGTVASSAPSSAKAVRLRSPLTVSRENDLDVAIRVPPASPDAAESVPKIKVAVGESLEAVVRALKCLAP